MELGEYIGQATYGLILISYMVRNVNWLRIFAIAASIAAIYYSTLVAREILWIPVLWNTLFILANTAQLLLTRWRARSVAMNPLETFLHKTVLANFPAAEVKSFAAFAQEGELVSGQQLIQAGTQLNHLFCLIQGKVDILANGNKVTELTPGYFLGEMSFLTHSHTRADVVAATNLKFLAWPHVEIEKWVDSDASRLALLNTALGTQVVDQLLRQNEALLKEAQHRSAG